MRVFFVILAHFAPILVQMVAKLSIFLGFTLNFDSYQLISMVSYYSIMFCHQFMQNVLKLRVILVNFVHRSCGVGCYLPSK